MGQDVTIVGAGVAGLAAARTLTGHGHSVRVLEKSRGVGGRMASRRIGDRRFDHGAQFFTVRSPEFAEVVDRAVAAGAVAEWTRGFGTPPDGHPRYRGSAGMTSLCKWMAGDAGIEPELSTTVVDLAAFPAAAHVLTAPVPQSLAILSFSGLLPDPGLAARLGRIAYVPTIAVLAGIAEAPTGIPAHGAVPSPDDDDFAFVTENRAKGVSARPALTIHLSDRRSQELWDRSDEEIVGFVAERIRARLGVADLGPTDVQRWRYAGPVEVHPEPTVVWGRDPVVALAGEAFAGPKVEGAFRSGVAAAEAVHAALG